MIRKCFECGKSEEAVSLQKCKVCRKHFCEEHGVQRSGVSFCSMGCGVYFFHGDADEDDG